MFKHKKGFTLIELLVVIAIIGILATIVLVSLNSARQKARDVRRVGDLRQVALALEMYYDDNGAYPAGTSGTAGTGKTAEWDAMSTSLSGGSTVYMTQVPVDPGSNTYDYVVCSSNTEYTLVATLENTSNSTLDTDVDGTACDGTTSCVDPIYCIEP